MKDVECMFKLVSIQNILNRVTGVHYKISRISMFVLVSDMHSTLEVMKTEIHKKLNM